MEIINELKRIKETNEITLTIEGTPEGYAVHVYAIGNTYFISEGDETPCLFETFIDKPLEDVIRIISNKLRLILKEQ